MRKILCNHFYKKLTKKELSVYSFQWQYTGDMYCMKCRDCSDDCRENPCRKATAEKPPAVLTDAQKLVIYAYGDIFPFKTQDLHFSADNEPAEEAAATVKLIPHYNAFNGNKVAAVILDIAELWPGEVTFGFGREYSPVLYINFPYFRGDNGTLIENRDELVEKSLAILRTARPDEITKEQTGVRAWWD